MSGNRCPGTERHAGSWVHLEQCGAGSLAWFGAHLHPSNSAPGLQPHRAPGAGGQDAVKGGRARRRHGMRPAPSGLPELGFESRPYRDPLRCPGRTLPSLDLGFPMPDVSEGPGSWPRTAWSPQAVTPGGAAVQLPQHSRPSPARPRERGRARTWPRPGARLGGRGRDAPPPDPPPAQSGQSEGAAGPVWGDALGAGPAGAEESPRAGGWRRSGRGGADDDRS